MTPQEIPMISRPHQFWLDLSTLAFCTESLTGTRARWITSAYASAAFRTHDDRIRRTTSQVCGRDPRESRGEIARRYRYTVAVDRSQAYTAVHRWGWGTMRGRRRAAHIGRYGVSKSSESFASRVFASPVFLLSPSSFAVRGAIREDRSI